MTVKRLRSSTGGEYVSAALFIRGYEMKDFFNGVHIQRTYWDEEAQKMVIEDIDPWDIYIDLSIEEDNLEITPIYSWIVKLLWPFFPEKCTITTGTGTYKVVKIFGYTLVDWYIFR